MQAAAVEWLRDNAGSLQSLGVNAGRALTYTLLGMVIGAFVALRRGRPVKELAPLARSLYERVTRLGLAFRRVVFAQVWISAINTLFTGCYLAVALPAFGIELPLTKTLIAVTFVCGLLPVIGNIISNTVITVVSLSHSWELAAVSLCYLVVIHKLEYFLNARIIGGRIQARAWEMLVAMLAMEAAFGIAGLVAAPVFYAYLKSELSARRLISPATGSGSSAASASAAAMSSRRNCCPSVGDSGTSRMPRSGNTATSTPTSSAMKLSTGTSRLSPEAWR